MKEIKLERIKPNPNQPRKNFDEDGILSLAESIKEKGLLQPIVVTAVNGNYLLVAGERRYRACKLLGLENITCVIISTDDIYVTSLVENLQREDLSSLEEAEAYKELIDKGMTQMELAKVFSKSQGRIAQMLAMLKLPKKVQEALVNKKIQEGHARQLLSLGKFVNSVIDKDNFKETHIYTENKDIDNWSHFLQLKVFSKCKGKSVKEYKKMSEYIKYCLLMVMFIEKYLPGDDILEFDDFKLVRECKPKIICDFPTENSLFYWFIEKYQEINNIPKTEEELQQLYDSGKYPKGLTPKLFFLLCINLSYFGKNLMRLLGSIPMEEKLKRLEKITEALQMVSNSTDSIIEQLNTKKVKIPKGLSEISKQTKSQAKVLKEITE